MQFQRGINLDLMKVLGALEETTSLVKDQTNRQTSDVVYKHRYSHLRTE